MKNILKYSVIIALFTVFGCGNNAKVDQKSDEVSTDETIVKLTEAQAKQINLQVTTVAQKNMSGVLKLNGQIDVPPQNLIAVSVPLGGYLKSSQLLPGKKVSKGQLLANMEDPQYIQLQQDYLIVKNKLAYANKEYDRQKELNVGKANSDKVLQVAESELRQLSIESSGLAEKLRLIGLNPDRLTERNMSRAIKIYSPINGYVSKVNVNIGKYVTPSEVLFELVNPADIHLNLVVYEKDLQQLVIGQRVIAYSNANPTKKYNTEILLISHALNQDRSAEVHCHFEKYDKSLAPGMYMNAEVQLANKKVNTLPDEAIVSFENRDYVFVALANQSYQLTAIKKGQSEGGFTAIDTDLGVKKVVVKGAYSLLMKLKNTAEE